MDSIKYPNIAQIPITPETLALTANQRLARRITESYDQKQLQSGHLTFKSANVFALTTWLSIQAATHLSQQILSDEQAHYIWEDIITQTPEGAELLNPGDTAAIALSAWNTLHLWERPLDALASNSNQDVALFYKWSLEFKHRCNINDWLTASQIPNALLSSHFQTPTHHDTLFIGFDELPPAIQSLTAPLNPTHLQIEKPALCVGKIALHDQEVEIQTMAQFAKEILDKNPKARIGCIIPELETLRRTLFNTFTNVFTPQVIFPGSVAPEKRFNISAGQRLNEFPLINTALSCLEWLKERITISKIGTTLQSPYIHVHADEQNTGAQLDIALRESYELEIPFQRIFHIKPPEDTSEHDHPHLLTRLYNTHKYIQSLPKSATLVDWKKYITKLLNTIGWPGYRTLNSDEYQLYTRWQKLLDDYIHYANVLPEQKITASKAFYLLDKFAKNTVFQSEGSHASVQILGILEAAGNNFDHMWVMGLDDTTWPPAPKPNPFIPYEMQKSDHMPHATPERERLYTEHMMHRLLHSAKNIIMSYPAFEGDRPINPSPLLASIQSTQVNLTQKTVTSPITLESLHDEKAPARSRSERIKGGSAILKQQAQCPFKAFASIRLNAYAPKAPYFGLLAHERGTITHDILERIWRQLKSQATLNALSPQALDELITQTLEMVMNEQEKSSHSNFKRELFLIEKKRLKKLITEWLTAEKKRAPFTVTAIETAHTLKIGTLTMSVRIDRIDTLKTGERIIIDYKTSINTVNSWLKARPTDPQLPLYLCLNSTYNAIAYAQVRPHSCVFKGICDNAETAKNVSGLSDIKSKHHLNWEEQIKTWQSTLNGLCNEFESGVATVTPESPLSCTYCEFQPLCRVDMA